ncbi:uncharacterized protein LOC123259170 isoform X3 [Cotesia glomerata]|uniref:uncharacterized protein LOC123259170 isoform X3 n=1 Tax=Cotesia glomerata TaxID=32391 RepID=UPI001D019EBA|nr:uncharacterized protein LOC123259170 isoform X3 [Cotesia glomerata]
MERISYLIIRDGVYILSNNERYSSTLEKIHISFDLSLILGTIIISIITYLVLLFANLNRTCSFSTFEIIRLWISVSLNTRMNSQPLRIFFSSIVIYFLVMHITLQGDLVDRLSKSKLRKNVDSLSDLRNNYYQKIFTVHDVSTDDFEHENIEIAKKLITTPYSYGMYVKNVIKDPSSVCIAYYNWLWSELSKDEFSENERKSLHLSKYPISTRPRGYIIPANWTLKKKFNNFLMSIDSNGMNTKTEANKFVGTISNLQTSEYVASFKPISLDSVSLFFFFWFAGITLSFICFLFETFDGFKEYILNCIGGWQWPDRLGTRFSKEWDPGSIPARTNIFQ